MRSCPGWCVCRNVSSDTSSLFNHELEEPISIEGRHTAKLLVGTSSISPSDSKLTKAPRLTADGKERLQRLAIQSSTGDFFAVVGHEVDHKVVSTIYDNRRDRRGEIVGVVEDGPPSVVVVVSSSFGESVCFSHVVKLFESSGLEDAYIATIEVSISLL